MTTFVFFICVSKGNKLVHVETFLQAKLLVVEELHKGWGERMLARFRRSGATEEVMFCFIVVDECVYDAHFCGRW